jgi:hypothetical protein
LLTAGFRLLGPDADGYAHRYERGGLVVDVLAPDGIQPPPSLSAGLVAVGVPGGTQALVRSEMVTVRLGGQTFELRRPTLLGAVLIKTRALLVHHDPDAQVLDLLTLLSLVEDPRQTAAELKRSERGWLRAAEPHLLGVAAGTLDPERVGRAQLALRLLLQER